MNATPVSALVVAAGLAQRMGQFKVLLPWGTTSVVGQIVNRLETAGVTEIVVVTGHRADDVTQALADTKARTVFNPGYAAGEMISSIQAGLAALDERAEACLLCLGDQPQMQASTVIAILTAGKAHAWQQVIIPSYQMRAGHPLLLPRWLWQEVIRTDSDLRTVLATHRTRTQYTIVDTSTVLADLDTADEYQRWRQAAWKLAD